MTDDVDHAPPLVVRLRGGYRLARVDAVVEQLQPIYAINTPATVHVDLRGLVHISPGPLATLVAGLKDIDDNDLVADDSYYRPPNNALVARYLARMDVERLLIDEPPDESFARRPPRGFRPLQTFASESEAADVTNSLTMALKEACSPDSSGQAAIWFAVNEVTLNVIQHASTSFGGVAVAQRARRRHEFELAIADCGVGIRESLTKAGGYPLALDDLAAIRAALAFGVTSKPLRNSGLGLFMTQLLLKLNGGTLLVRSGTAAVERGATDREWAGLPRIKGTLVAFRARIDRPLSLQPVFEALERARDSRANSPSAGGTGMPRRARAA